MFARPNLDAKNAICIFSKIALVVEEISVDLNYSVFVDGII